MSVSINFKDVKEKGKGHHIASRKALIMLKCVPISNTPKELTNEVRPVTPSDYSIAAAKPTTSITDPPRAEEAPTSVAPPVLAAAAGLVLLLVSAGLFEDPLVLAAAPVFVAPVLLTLPAAGFAVAPASVEEVEDSETSSSAAPAVIVTGRNVTSVRPWVMVMTLGTVSMGSVSVDRWSLAPVCEAVQIALVVPSSLQLMVAIISSTVYGRITVEGP